MGLSKKAIKEFKQIYFEENGEEISDQKALELGTKLINLFRVICRPIPKKKTKRQSNQ
jgi:hypothetical protein